MARRYTALVLIALLAILLSPATPARAQDGACPPGSYKIGTPEGTWPTLTIMCTYNVGVVSVVSTNPETWPCSQHVLHKNLHPITGTPQHWIVVVPYEHTFLGQRARIEFLVFTKSTLPQVFPPGHEIDDVEIIISHHNRNGQFYSQIRSPLSKYRKINTFWLDGLGVRRFYPVYIVEEHVPATPHGGYFMIKLDYGESGVLDTDHDWALSSLHVGSENYTFPEHCLIPNANLPGAPPTPSPQPTPTLLPTWTPNPGATATPVPQTTPEATAPPDATAYPTWTPSPVFFPTTQAETTPTPWAPVVLPTVDWPTPRPTEIWASGDGGDGSAGDGLADLVAAINNDWQPAIDSTDDWADPHSDSTGTVAPVIVAMEMAQNISKPISYVKSIGYFMPNLAPYVTYLLMLASIIVFSILSKFSLSLAARILEIIRRILELIPGM